MLTTLPSSTSNLQPRVLFSVISFFFFLFCNTHQILWNFYRSIKNQMIKTHDSLNFLFCDQCDPWHHISDILPYHVIMFPLTFAHYKGVCSAKILIFTFIFCKIRVTMYGAFISQNTLRLAHLETPPKKKRWKRGSVGD